MKKYLLAAVIVCAAVCGAAERIGIQPGEAVTGNYFRANGKLYRVWGIAAPDKGQRFYEASKAALQQLLVETPGMRCYLVDRKTPDAILCGPRGQNTAMEMLKMGLAFHLPRETQKEAKLHQLYESCQKEAQQRRCGIWFSLKPEKPRLVVIQEPALK